MWLYVPSVCLPESADLTLALDSPETIAPFVTSKGKFIQPASLQRAWRTKLWMKRLSGLILQPSTARRGVDAWISLLPARPANPTVSPEQKKDSTTSEAAPSSSISPGSSEKSGHPWSSWKTSASGSQVDIFETSDSAYQDWVTESRRRSMSLRAALERRIAGSEFSSWPTATVADSGGSRAGPEYGTEGRNAGTTLTDATRQWGTFRVGMERLTNAYYDRGKFNLEEQAGAWATAKGKRQVGLESQTQHWPTPGAADDKLRASTPEMAAKRQQSGKQMSIEAAVMMWPTPASRDHKGSLPLGQRDRTMATLDEAAEQKFSHPGQMTPPPGQPSSPTTPSAPRRLSPIFVEWLMGWPINWTSARTDSGVQATEWCRWRRQSRSTFYLLRLAYKNFTGKGLMR